MLKPTQQLLPFARPLVTYVVLVAVLLAATSQTVSGIQTLRLVVESSSVRAKMSLDLPLIQAKMQATLKEQVSLTLMSPTDVPDELPELDEEGMQYYNFDVTISDIYGQLCLSKFNHKPAAHKQLPSRYAAMDSVAFVTVVESPWTSIASMAGAKVVVVRNNEAVTSTWLMASQTFHEHGLSMWNDFDQVLEVVSEVTAMRMLQQRQVDVVVIPGGALERLVGNGIVAAETVHVISQRNSTALWKPTSLRSSDVFPGIGVMVAHHVPTELAVAFETAILQLDVTDSNATVPWTYPLSLYHAHQSLYQAVALPFRNIQNENQCFRDRQPQHLAPCEGIGIAAKSSICDTTACLDGASCYCFECTHNNPIEVYATELGGDTHSIHDTCLREHHCFNVTQGSEVQFEINANDERWEGKTAEVSFLPLHIGNVTQVDSNTVLESVADATVTPQRPGDFIVSVKLDGRHMDQSPFLLWVNALPCDGANQIMSDDGVCVCTADTTGIRGSCLTRGQVFGRIVLPTMIAVTVLCYVALEYHSRKQDEAWKIAESALQYAPADQQAGDGNDGDSGRDSAHSAQLSPIQRATYNGMSVICQPIGSSSQDTTKARERAMSAVPQKGTVAYFASQTLNSLKGAFGKVFIRDHAAVYTRMRQIASASHPNLAATLGVCFSPDDAPLLVTRTYENGTLHSLINGNQYLVDDMMLSIMKDVVSGMYYLHTHVPPIIHGNLNSKNILVDSVFSAKISNYHGITQTNTNAIISTADMADYVYYSPERLLEDKTSTLDDVYAFAIIASECLTQKRPYDGEELDEVLEEVANLELRVPRRPKINTAKCSKEILELIAQCWSPRSLNRPNFSSISIRFRSIKGLGASFLSSQDEGQRQARILNEVFPDHVAEALKAGKKVEPQEMESVTLFYSDIVGFTKISSGLTPAHVSDMLDRLYTEFDKLCEKYSLFKVETIGDAYVCAGNVQQEEQPNHTALVCKFAMDACQAATKIFIDRNNPDLGTLSIRCGIHTGPVVASIVGAKNPRYCLFGETVAMTERMEATSQENYIQLSEEAAAMLTQQAPKLTENLQSRGMQAITPNSYKETFFLLRAAQIKQETMTKSFRATRKCSANSQTSVRMASETSSLIRFAHTKPRGSSSRLMAQASIQEQPNSPPLRVQQVGVTYPTQHTLGIQHRPRSDSQSTKERVTDFVTSLQSTPPVSRKLSEETTVSVVANTPLAPTTSPTSTTLSSRLQTSSISPQEPSVSAPAEDVTFVAPSTSPATPTHLGMAQANTRPPRNSTEFLSPQVKQALPVQLQRTASGRDIQVTITPSDE
eukprot:m.54504 g.54504  ORF g.54504 m.54504 type:complete len:1317 (+) comp11426_c0_seq2:668-4618(+)